MVEEAEVVVRPWITEQSGIAKHDDGRWHTEGIVLVGHDIGERVGDVTALDDLLRFIGVIRELRISE